MPINKVNRVKGSSVTNSRLFISNIFLQYCVFILPYEIRLNNHSEEQQLKTILADPKTPILLLILNNPAKTRNSPTKLLVPGNPKFAKVKKQKKIMQTGMT